MCRGAAAQAKPGAQGAQGGTDALPTTLLRHPPIALHAFKCPAWQVPSIEAVRVKGAGTEGVPWRTRRAASSRSGRRLRRWTPTEIHRVVRWSAAKRR